MEKLFITLLQEPFNRTAYGIETDFLDPVLACIVDLLIAPLMELKHGNAIDNAPLFMLLLIAPLMELKPVCCCIPTSRTVTFNRTAYGIETK